MRHRHVSRGGLPAARLLQSGEALRPPPNPLPQPSKRFARREGSPGSQESQGRDSPPVAKPARKLFQTKVRLQTASPHAPVAPLPTPAPSTPEKWTFQLWLDTRIDITAPLGDDGSDTTAHSCSVVASAATSTVHHSVATSGLLFLLDQLQAQRLQFPQTALDPRLGIAAPGRDHRLARSVAHVLGALGGQPQDAGLLELLQHAQRGLDPVATGRRMPVEVLADRLRQFLAAQGREGGDHLLHLGDLPAGEAPTEEGGRLELFYQGFHERI